MAMAPEMVPNISPNGRSFRGAGAYHLHDKPTPADLRPRTSLRVAFTATRNLANDDPNAALDEMWRTADDAPHLKAISGAGRQGRKNDKPVKTVSLAWAPGQHPTRTEMIAAADGFLRSMDWQGHQAIYAAHDDTAHPHLHIILNRVHPETGRTLNDWQERKRAQAWALTYERNQGKLLCEARAVRYEIGMATPAAGLPYKQAKLLARHSLAARQSLAREARAAFRPAWARHFRRQRAILSNLAEERRSAQRLAASLAREGNAAGALATLNSFHRRHTRVLRTLTSQRAALGRAQCAALRTRVRPTQLSGRHQPVPVRHPTAANDNSGHHTNVARRAGARSGSRFRPLLTYSAKPPVNSVRLLRATQRSERQLLLALQAAAYAALRRNSSAAQARSLARSEIALAFASRWADIERMPPALRAAAAAALSAEQAAALSARLRYHSLRLRADERGARLQLSRQHTTARRALAHRHILAWGAAAAAINALRAARPPTPLPRGGAGLLPPVFTIVIAAKRLTPVSSYREPCWIYERSSHQHGRGTFLKSRMCSPCDIRSPSRSSVLRPLRGG